MDLILLKIASRFFPHSRRFQTTRSIRYGLLLLIGLFYSGICARGQTVRAYERAGDKAVQQKDFGAAIQHYGMALQRRSGNAGLLWKYAECARELHAYPLAEQKYREMEDILSAKKPEPLFYFRLGQVLKSQGRYPEAIAAFDKFLATDPPPNTEYAAQARQESDGCRWAQQQLPDGSTPTVTNIGTKVNSPYSDFAPFMAGDTLYFSSYRFDKRGDKNRPRTKLTKLMYAIKEGRAREISRGFPNVDTAHVAHSAFTRDGHFFFFTMCKNLNASDIRCEMWLAVKDIRGRWGTPVRLPEPINLSGYTTTHPAIGYDSLGEQLNLWFASDRPGGKGGLDIWYTPLDTIWFCPCNVPVDSRKPLRMPRFTEPVVNMAAVNTPGEEITPFFHEQTQSLYFSSDAPMGFGGFDVFRSERDSAGYAPPVNAGPGLNSSYNDLYFVLRPDGNKGYLSSNRPGSQYLDADNKSCCNDLYRVEYPQPQPQTPPSLVETPAPVPRVPIERPMIPIERLQDPDPVKPDPEPTELADFVGLPLYFDNDEPDKRTRRTRTNKTYAETAQAYLSRVEEYREKFALGVPVSRREGAEESIDNFFEEDVRRGYERLDQLCQMLLFRLERGEPVEVVIKGFTSPRAESDYNLALGKRRISSVRNHFEAYSDGALAGYIRSGKLKISEASFGETTARSGISDDLKDERNSIYNPEAARERRVEIVEIRETQ